MTRIERVVAAISRLIAEGHLAPGMRIASVRAAAREYGVSKNTIVEAYERLVAAGTLVSRAGSGFFVATARKPPANPRPMLIAEATDHVSLLREQLDKHYAVRVGDGRPPSDWTDGSELGRHLHPRRKRGDAPPDHGYGTPQGYEPLRARLAQMLIERGIAAGPDQILTTFGANHGLDLVIRHFLEPGDAVLVDSPGYYPLFGKLLLARAAIVPVARGTEGPDLDALEARAAETRPKLYFTQALAHNPTGTSMSLAAMHRLLRIADRYGFLVVEDDPFADILPALAPRLAALDQLARVVYVCTFSKTLSASLRSGFLAADPRLIASLTDIKMLSVVNSSGHVERLIHDLIAEGHYRRHLRRLTDRVAHATAATMAALRRIGFADFAPPAGGYYLWCGLPAGLDDLALAGEASAQGIFLAPGSLFCRDRVGYRPAIRVNVAYGDHPALLDLLRRHAG
ncbi:PLP-dependent aminotransferase family protein [Rhabdaerophilum calidifontis]|uniref:aminotransferase-like domain-containing protein n=1 Tax=Rhabdaerophilum calidifontis TaxID=2604328 RepID=UPI0012393B61|nr:PLP-dependent aminotransferase family protein [Rhabdaerophilum calidifontis]